MVPKIQADFSLKECWWCLRVWEEERPPVRGEKWSCSKLVRPNSPFPPQLQVHRPAPSPPPLSFSPQIASHHRDHHHHLNHFFGLSPQLSLISYGHWSVLFFGRNGLVWSQHARVHDIHLTALHPDIFVFRDKLRASSYLIKSSSRSTWLPSSANFLFCPRPLHKLRSTAPCTPDPSSTILNNVSPNHIFKSEGLVFWTLREFHKKSGMKIVGSGSEHM